MRTFQLIAALLLLFSLGCDKKYSAEQQPRKASKVTLTGMSPEKLVRTKYDGLRVICGLNTHPTWSPTAITLARAEWNILQDFSDSKSIEFAAEVVEGSRITVSVTLDRLTIISNLNLKDESGTEHLLKNTPVVQAQVSWKHKMPTHFQQGNTSRITMIEGIPAQLLTLSTTTAESDANDQIHHVRITCQTLAVAKPEYQDEHVKK